MKITYVAHTRFPTEKAHGYQMAQVCHALAGLGHEVTLLAPTVRNAVTQDAFGYYGITPAFMVVYPGSFDALGSRYVPGPLGFSVSMWSYRKALKRCLEEHPADLLYVRSPALLGPLLETGKPVVLELHTLPSFRSPFFVRRCNGCALVVCLTRPLRDALVAFGVHPQKVVVEGDGADLARFARLPSAEKAKTAWELPSGKPVIGYVGSFVTQNTIEKGVAELIRALAILKEKKIPVFGWCVGGTPEWIGKYRALARSLGLMDEDLRLQEHIPAAKVPSAISACDVCVYPAPQSDHPFFLRDTSPLKLFEYLAAGKPVVCAELPPIRDAVDESVVLFCPPGDPQALADALADVIGNPAEAAARSRKGLERVKQFAWPERMRRILARVVTRA